MKKDYKTLSFFQRGKRRQAVLCSLTEPKTPKEVATACKISISNVSNAIAELVKEGYVKVINPDAHTFKYYNLTVKGKKALKLVNAQKEQT